MKGKTRMPGYEMYPDRTLMALFLEVRTKIHQRCKEEVTIQDLDTIVENQNTNGVRMKNSAQILILDTLQIDTPSKDLHTTDTKMLTLETLTAMITINPGV